MDDGDDWMPELTAEGHDPDFDQLDANINWGRPALMLAVIAFAVYLGTQFTTEISYFFSSSEPIELGEVTEFPERTRANPDNPPEVPNNRYVSLSGIPTRPSISCNPPTRYFKLIGAHVYVEKRIDDKLSTMMCKAGKSERNPREGDDPIFFEGAGRAVSFAAMSKNYSNLKGFYERNYGELFCSSMTEAKREARVKLLRDMLREKHKLDHGSYPDDDTLEKLLAGETVCYNAYFIQAGQAPGDYWHYLLIYIVLGLIILWNISTIVRWARRYLL